MAVVNDYGVTDGDLCLLYISMYCNWTQKFSEKQTRKPTGFWKKPLDLKKKQQQLIFTLKNGFLVHLVELMEFTHFITVDDISIISKKTLKEYFSPFLPLHCREVSLLPDFNNMSELVLVA